MSALAAFVWVAIASAAPPDGLSDAVVESAGPRLVAVVVEQSGHTQLDYRARAGSTRGPKRTDHPELHDIRSAGKSITALAVGVAIHDGLLTTETAVWPLLGSTDPAYAQITVHDLLTMSSPLACDDGRRTPGNEERMYRTPVWRDFALAIPLDPDFIRGPNGQGRFSYCTAGVFLLGQVVQTVANQPFDQFVQQRIFDPLGIEEVEWARSDSGEVQSGGQLAIGAADLAKIGRLVLDGGTWNGETVVEPSWIKRMLTPSHGSGPEHAYGYLWWFRTFDSPSGPQPSAYMSGNGGNVVALFRDYDAVVVVQSANYNRRRAHQHSFAVVEAALAELEPAP